MSAPHRDLIPNLRIFGQLDSVICRLGEPVTGEFIIENCDAEIKSIELQLVRVETYGSNMSQTLDNDGASASVSGAINRRDLSSDSTEVQNIQIGDGNVLRNIPLDIYMVLPRLFTCPTLITDSFRIGKYWVDQSFADVAERERAQKTWSNNYLSSRCPLQR